MERIVDTMQFNDPSYVSKPPLELLEARQEACHAQAQVVSMARRPEMDDALKWCVVRSSGRSRRRKVVHSVVLLTVVLYTQLSKADGAKEEMDEWQVINYVVLESSDKCVRVFHRHAFQ